MRLSRLAIPGQAHHLMQSALEGLEIARDDVDRARLLAVLAEAAQQCEVAMHAYVLLPGSIELLLTPRTVAGLGAMVQSVGRRYASWFNRRHGRLGTLWRGRYRSGVVEPGRWLLACMCYIECGPVRQGLAQRAEDYHWSSARHHLGQGAEPWLTDHACYWELGNTPFEREAAYRRLLIERLSLADQQRLLASCRRGLALGSDAYVERLERDAGRALRSRRRGRPAKGGPA